MHAEIFGSVRVNPFTATSRDTPKLGYPLISIYSSRESLENPRESLGNPSESLGNPRESPK